MMRLIFAAVLVTLSMNVDLSSTSSIITPLNGWIKYACTAENIKRSKTYFCDTTGKIHCLPGWTDESQLCQVPVCEINGQDCVRGNCSKPFTCDCEVGWTGPFCDKCVCLPGCVNGHCNQSFECICETGWQGMLCDKPVCEGCIHGDCVMPGMCICHPGWSGPDCSICENRLDCQNGRCIDEPYQCECYDGYFGPSCEFPVCREGCHPDNGWCMMPDTCWCREGWTGPNCTECVPYWNCNHGHCVKPWECICDEGYFGRECNETQNIDGQWGQWSDETPCSVTCGNGTKTRKRHCDNPPKSGNGSYCSLDGSSSTEVIPCNLGPCDNVNGQWSAWSSYSACTTTCGAGTRTRTRVCNNPPPSGSGANCIGEATETSACVGNPPCPIDGGYTEWTQYSPCTAKCVDEIGDRVRRRFCTNPTPQFGGKDCSQLGPDREQIPCNGTIPRQSTDPTKDCFTIFE